MLTPEEVNLFWRVSQRAGEFKIKDKHQRGGGKRNFPGDIKACTNILRQGKAGFKNKQTNIIINNNKNRVQWKAEKGRVSGARNREVDRFVVLGRHFGLFSWMN